MVRGETIELWKSNSKLAFMIAATYQSSRVQRSKYERPHWKLDHRIDHQHLVGVHRLQERNHPTDPDKVQSGHSQSSLGKSKVPPILTTNQKFSMMVTKRITTLINMITMMTITGGRSSPEWDGISTSSTLTQALWRRHSLRWRRII